MSLAATLLALALGGGTGDVTPPDVGEPFPDLTFPTLDGELTSLAAFRGTKVLLIQFASW